MELLPCFHWVNESDSLTVVSCRRTVFSGLDNGFYKMRIFSVFLGLDLFVFSKIDP